MHTELKKSVECVLSDNNIESIILLSQHGSHLYKTNSENSDIDIFGIYMPPIKDLFFNKRKTTEYTTSNYKCKNKNGDIDITLKPLPLYLYDAITGQTKDIDVLYSSEQDWIKFNKSIWLNIYHNRQYFITPGLKTFVAYAKKQAAKYGAKGSKINSITWLIHALQTVHYDGDPQIKDAIRLSGIYDKLEKYISQEHLENITFGSKVADTKSGIMRYIKVWGREYEETINKKDMIQHLQNILKTYGERAYQAAQNEGIDYKALSHAYRALVQGILLCKNGEFSYPLLKEYHETIMAIKYEKLPWNVIDSLIFENMNMLNDLIESSEYVHKDIDKVKEYWSYKLLYWCNQIVKGDIEL